MYLESFSVGVWIYDNFENAEVINLEGTECLMDRYWSGSNRYFFFYPYAAGG